MTAILRAQADYDLTYRRGAPVTPTNVLVCGVKPPKRSRRKADPTKSASRGVTYTACSGLAQVVNDQNALPIAAVDHAALPSPAPIVRPPHRDEPVYAVLGPA